MARHIWDRTPRRSAPWSDIAWLVSFSKHTAPCEEPTSRCTLATVASIGTSTPTGAEWANIGRVKSATVRNVLLSGSQGYTIQARSHPKMDDTALSTRVAC